MGLLQPMFSTSHTGGERKRKTKLTENQMCSGVEGWEINMSVVFGLCVSCRRDNRARLQKESGGGAHGRSDCDINDEIFDSKQTSCVRLRNHPREKKTSDPGEHTFQAKRKLSSEEPGVFFRPV